MSSFAETLMELVVGPWQKHCSNAEFPWMAKPELRQRWLGAITSSDPSTSLSAAIGLARCAQPSFDEFKAVNEYFAHPPSDVTTDIVILDLLLTGGTPPIILAETFFLPNLNAKPAPTPLFWPFLASYLRHPANAEVAKMILALENAPSIAVYNALANPCLPSPEKYPQNRWFHALKVFHLKTPSPKEDTLLTDLERFAFFMRCDFPKDRFLQLSRDMLLEDPFFFAQLNHPCAFAGPHPEFDPTNPNAEALKYFSNDSPVCSLYRYYNPLLNYPWMAEEIASSEDDGVFMGLLLVGSAPLQIEHHHISQRKTITPIIQDHPAWEINLLNKFVDKLAEVSSPKSEG
ncbi:MAG: hypothetical protein ACOY3I_01310 [Verrucomicrobiota bacterium]